MKKIVILLLVLSHPMTHAVTTLQKTLKQKHLKCGVTTGLAGFSATNSKGEWVGIDVDICRAIATAIFNDPQKVKFSPTSSIQRFTAIQSGEIDVLSRVTTQTLDRDTRLGINFAPVTYYDGQAFMVRKKLGVKSVLELNGASICTQQGTTTELNLADYFRAKSMKFKPVVFESNDEVMQAFYKGRCDAFTTDASGLAAERTKFRNPKDFIILPELISKEPLAPAVRHGDDQWFDLVKWTIFALIAAEEFGMTSKNIDSFKKSKDPKIKRFLGLIPGNGKALGLKEDWSYNVIKKLGNYGEIFERNIGKNTVLKLERGLNDLWTKGGLMYSPPLR